MRIQMSTSDSSCKKRNVIDSVLTRVYKTLGGCLVYSTKDLLAFGIKNCMKQYIGNHHYITCGAIDVCSTSIIDYGCEAALAGYCEGIHKIPHRLVTYALADICYKQLHKFCESMISNFILLLNISPCNIF